MGTNEVGSIIIFEYILLYIVGVIVGIPFAAFISNILSKALATEAYTVPSMLSYNCFASGATGCFVAVMFSNVWLLKKIKNLDLLESLKEKK